jgi:hypothetical protein
MESTTTAQGSVNVQVVENLMGVLVKGLRAIQLYLPNNPIYQKAVENIRQACEPVWQEMAELPLQVAETQLAIGGEIVLDQPSKSDSVAWVLFKDGVRRLVLSPGAEDDEMVRFLNVLHKARGLSAGAEDDLLTLLWEEDFQHIRYDFVELGMEHVPAIETSEVEEERRPPEEVVRRQIQEEAQEPEPPPGVVSIEDFDSTLYFLDEKEIEYIRSEIDREYKQDLRGNVLGMLFDLLELQTYSTVRAELVSIVENFIPYLLAVGDFRSVAYILREIRVVLKRARELLPEHREQLERLPDTLSEAAALGQLLQALDEALVHPTEDELGELFRELKPQALETVLAWLPKLTNQRVRGLLDHAAERLAQAHPESLVRALRNDDATVLLETIRLSGQLKIPPVVPSLGEIVKLGVVEVRRAAVDALATIGSAGAMQQLEQAIADEDRDVRIAAVRVLAAKGHRGALPHIQSAVMGKELRNADLTEKTVFFEAYGMLVGAGGIETLRVMIEPKGLFGRKEDPQIRACAAMALGKIGTAEARELLERVAGDKDPLVRNAVNKALRESA